MTVKILPVSNVRNHLADVLRSIEKDDAACFMTRNGRAVAALLTMERYERLMSDLEDRLDEQDETLARDVAQARREFRTGRTSTWTHRRR